MKIRTITYLPILISLLCLACNQPADTLSEEPAPSLEGVWQMTDHYILQESDTVYVFEELAQQKIYLDGHVMWTTDPAQDSTHWHGFGTYELKGDTLIERLSSMSLPMQELWENGEEVILMVEYNEHNFNQSMEQVWQDTVYHTIETYKRLK